MDTGEMGRKSAEMLARYWMNKYLELVPERPRTRIDKPTLWWLREFTKDYRRILEEMPECFTDEQEDCLLVVEQILEEKLDEAN